MTQLHDDDPGRPVPPKLRWRCPICRVLLVLRPTTETEETFRDRCAAHEAAAKVCRAKLLIKDLRKQGLVPLRGYDPKQFTETYGALKEAGLVNWHPTHIEGDSFVRVSPWGPEWAAQYDTYLLRKSKEPLARRVAMLLEAAASSEDIDRIRAFLALQDREQFDLGGTP